MSDHTATPAAANPLQDLGELLARLDTALREPALRQIAGNGLLRELRYPISSFRQLYPQHWPSAQPTLF